MQSAACAAWRLRFASSSSSVRASLASSRASLSSWSGSALFTRVPPRISRCVRPDAQRLGAAACAAWGHLALPARCLATAAAALTAEQKSTPAAADSTTTSTTATAATTAATAASQANNQLKLPPPPPPPSPPSPSSQLPSDLNSPQLRYTARELDLSHPLPKLRYPVVLAHGYLGYASLLRSPVSGEPLLEYFGSVRSHLAAAGITVLTPVNPPAASIAARAQKLQIALGLRKQDAQETKLGSENTERRDVQGVEFRDTLGKSVQQPQKDSSPSIILGGRQIDLNKFEGKFHLIAHSMGGLDCRYLISHLQQNDDSDPSSLPRNRISSLTTIASPHRGSPIADMFLSVLDVPFAFRPDPAVLAAAPTFNKAAQRLAMAFGCDVSGLSNLATDAMRDFNARVKDHPDVAYMSYAGARRFSWYSPWYLPSQWIADAEARASARAAAAAPSTDAALPHACDLATEAGGANDGLVSVHSARWGRFCGTADLDHLEQIGLGVWNKHLPLYRQIVFRLHEIELQEERELAEQAQVQAETEELEALAVMP